MVVDDEVSVTTVLDRILTEEGYQVIVANSGKAALKALDEIVPDLIMLDIKMPEMDGYETLDQIKQVYEEVPVIMLTAVPDPVSINKSINLGADDYIRKPFRSAELIARIRAKLRRSGKL